MSSFDLLTLLKADFPRALCPMCGAIVKSWNKPLSAEVKSKRERECIICKQVWKLPDGADNWKLFFKEAGTLLPSLPDPIGHAKNLAAVAADFYRDHFPISPMEAFFRLLARSRYFIHFATLNISDAMLGVLAMAATHIPVRGIVGIMDTRQIELLNTFSREVKNLDVMVWGEKSAWHDTPHLKLLIFDGLISIEGSANLTQTAWIKASENKERIRIVTDLEEVYKLNNEYFSKNFRSPSFKNFLEFWGGQPWALG